jgi:DNA polymerase-3 subunit delta'
MIIWMAEKMNQPAANKLLKILEEPPEKTLFILVCESEEQLLATILSRTQMIRVSKVTDEDLCNELISKHDVSPQEASHISFLVEGNVNEALHIVKQENKEVQNFELFRDWMRMCLKFDTQKVTRWIDSVATIGRESQKNFLVYATQILRSCLMKNYGVTDLAKAEGEILDFIEKFAPFIHGGNCEQFVNELNRASFHIERNANPKILFMDLSLKANELLNIPAQKVV